MGGLEERERKKEGKNTGWEIKWRKRGRWGIKMKGLCVRNNEWDRKR